MSLLVLTGSVVALTTLGLNFYAIQKAGLGSFRLRARIMRVFDFSIEIDSPRRRDLTSDEGKDHPPS
jgi:hypothetical protein